MLRKWAFFSMNLKKEKSTRQKTCQIVSEIGIFSQDPDPDPDPHFLRIRIRIRTGQKQADPGGSGSGSGSETLLRTKVIYIRILQFLQKYLDPNSFLSARNTFLNKIILITVKILILKGYRANENTPKVGRYLINITKTVGTSINLNCSVNLSDEKVGREEPNRASQ